MEYPENNIPEEDMIPAENAQPDQNTPNVKTDSYDPTTEPVDETADEIPETVTAAEAIPQHAEAPEPDDAEQEMITRRKVSPYENSPYVVNRQAEPVRPARPKKARKGGFWKTAICTLLILALVGGGCIATAYVTNGMWMEKFESLQESYHDLQQSLDAQLKELEKKLSPVSTGISVSGTPSNSTIGGLTPAQVYAMNVRSVVMIHTEVTNSMGQTGTATGSGFIITEDGYVVTNFHVVEDGSGITVITSYGEEHPAKLIGADETNDVALLKVEATGLQPVKIGRSSDLIVGDQVVAIGNPLGELTTTLTVGYVSAMERDVTTDGFAINMIQTDAAINSGNSGGPLFNMKGEVIGITTAKYSGTSSSGASIEGVGFAIPSDDVTDLLDDLMTHGYITGAFLGVSVSDMNAEAANYYGLPMGAYVQSVQHGYSAQRAGVLPKDIIVQIGDIKVDNVNDLTRALRSFAAGDETVIIVYRGGKAMELPITLDAKPAN